jgi:protein-tyrosine phosphatase
MRRRCQLLGLPWLIASAGTRAQPGLPLHPFTSRLLTGHNDDVRGWRSRHVTLDLVSAADVIVTASAEHRNAVLWLFPQAARRTFLLQQLARFCALSKQGLTGNDGSRSALEAQLALVNEFVPRPSAQDDLFDPIGRPYRWFRRTDQQIESATDRLLRCPGASEPFTPWGEEGSPVS